MRVGIPTEIKVQEFRVGITPAGVHALKEAGHTVLVQKGAGLGSMITDEEYVAAGAQMVATAKECWDCDMVVKVKEPLAPEYDHLPAPRSGTGPDQGSSRKEGHRHRLRNRAVRQRLPAPARSHV